jgi:hypothetical protein
MLLIQYQIEQTNQTNSNQMDQIQFHIGGGLPIESPVYIEREADMMLFREIQNMSYVLITEPRQQGKTSIIIRLISVFESTHYLNNKYLMIYIDAEGLPYKQSEALWYMDIYNRVYEKAKQKLNLDGIPIPSEKLSWRLFLSKLVDAPPLNGTDQPNIVIVFDEVGSMPNEWSEDFYTTLREVYNNRGIYPKFKKITFIFVGTFDPRDQIKNNDISPFNIAEKIFLKDFTLDQVKLLIALFSLPDDISTIIARALFEYTGGQPYLTQKICSILSQFKEINNEDNIKQAVDRFFQEDSNHLPRIFTILENNPSLYSAIMRIQKEKIIFSPTTNRIHFNLAHVLGLICAGEHNFCIIRNTIYQRALKEFLNTNETPDYKIIKIYSENIKLLIGSDKILEALNLLGKICSSYNDKDVQNEFILLKNQYSRYENESTSGLTSTTELTIMKNKIVSRIISLVSKID